MLTKSLFLTLYEAMKVLQDCNRPANLDHRLTDNPYEAKYKDLKESFRLYRKKAKEIFEAQQRGEVSMLDTVGGGNDRGMDEARLSYLRNLMVNYLSSDPAVREHMEGAIGTVLKFTSEDTAKITKKKAEHDSSWMTF